MSTKIKNGFDSLPQYEKDHKVHHLGINESQIGEGCILTSNLERVELIKDTFETAKRQAFHREYISYTGECYGVRMSCLSFLMISVSDGSHRTDSSSSLPSHAAASCSMSSSSPLMTLHM